MKNHVSLLLTNPKYQKAIKWGKLISVTGGGQVLIQLFGLVSGIIIVRLLPTKEYALYTLANTMLGTMTILADGGISTGLMAQGGKVWQDKYKLGVVLSTGLDLRRKFAVSSLLVSIPILTYLLLHHDASKITTILIVAALIPAFFSALSDSLLEMVPKLHQDIKPLQKNQVMVSTFRLILSSVSLFVFPWTFVALLANGIPRIYGNFRLRKITFKFAEKNAPTDSEVRSEILTIVKKIMPGAVYYSLSGQLTIWLISIFGTTQSLASIGALGRLSLLLTVFTSVFSMLIVPRFARLKGSDTLIFTRFFQILGIVGLCCLFVLAAVYLFSNQILWVLGSKYQGLSQELFLNMISACIAMLSGMVFSLGSCRGKVLNPAITISLNLSAIIIGVLIFDLSSLKGVIIFNIFVNTVNFFRNSTYNILQLTKKTKSI
jgi:O-antigen/teichoic acid export membrane protein